MVKHIAGDPDDRDADRNAYPVQNLPVAQKRDRPAYCFQHLDLELRSHDDVAHADFTAVSAMLAPRRHVVACFEPKWNSLDTDKTRSFNILGASATAESVVLLHSLRRPKAHKSKAAREGCP
jgi:hypothetical protein